METPTVAAPVPGAGDTPATTENDLITIAGGVELEVTHLDGSKETVRVRQVPVSKIQPFIFAIGWGNMAEEIEIACEQKKGWADKLSGESAIALEEKARELNLPFVKAWSESQAKWKEAMAADKMAELQARNALLEKQVEMLTKAASPSPSSAPP